MQPGVGQGVDHLVGVRRPGDVRRARRASLRFRAGERRAGQPREGNHSHHLGPLCEAHIYYLCHPLPWGSRACRGAAAAGPRGPDASHRPAGAAGSRHRANREAAAPAPDASHPRARAGGEVVRASHAPRACPIGGGGPPPPPVIVEERREVYEIHSATSTTTTDVTADGTSTSTKSMAGANHLTRSPRTGVAGVRRRRRRLPVGAVARAAAPAAVAGVRARGPAAAARESTASPTATGGIDRHAIHTNRPRWWP